MIVTKLAKALGLDTLGLFFLANRLPKTSLSAQPDEVEVSASVLNQLRKDQQLRRTHNISKTEIEMLSRLITFGCDLGPIHSLRDLLYMLNTIRHAVGR